MPPLNAYHPSPKTIPLVSFPPASHKKIALIAGAVSLTSISGMISGLIGADDALASGAETSKGVMKGIGGAIGFGMGAAGLIGGAAKAAVKLPGAALNAGHKLGKDIKKIATDGKDKDINNVEGTTQDINNEAGGGNAPTGGPQAPDPNQGVGNATGGSTPPAGGGGGTPSSPAPSAPPAGGQANGMTSGSTGGGSDKGLIGDRFNNKAVELLGKGARATGRHLEGATGGGGVARAAKQGVRATGKAFASTAKTFSADAAAASTAASFKAMKQSKSLGGKIGHFSAGVAKAIGTGFAALPAVAAAGVTAAAMGARTVVRGAGMTLRMGGAVLKNVALPAVKSVAKGVGKVGGLLANAATGGEWSESAMKPIAAAQKAKSDEAKANKQKALNKALEKEVEALDAKYGANVGSVAYNAELESIMNKYRIKGLKI